MKKKIMVYGLRRSGTNYVEFLIRNNIDCEYENKYEDSQASKLVAIKHTPPSLDYGDCFIIIIKTSGNFVRSWAKKGYCPPDKIIGFYKDAIHNYIEFYLNNKDKVAIVFHEDLIGREALFIRAICKKFDLSALSGNLTVSNMRTDKSGGMGFEDGVYVFEDCDEVAVNREYELIKTLKLNF